MTPRGVIALGALFIVAGALFIFSVVDRSRIIRHNAETVCQKIHRLDLADEAIVGQLITAAELRPFIHDPAALKAAVAAAKARQQRELALLRAADCTP